MWILYPCYNNYDLMFGENKDFLLKYSNQIIVIDDHSCEAEKLKGKEQCKIFDIKFEVNPKKGIQAAVDYVVNNLCGPKDWVLVLQQDVSFLNCNAISEFTKVLKKIEKNNYQIGGIGFPNYVPDSHYNKNIHDESSIVWKNCWMGNFSFSPSSFHKTKNIANFIYRTLSRVPFIENIERRIWHKLNFHRGFSPLQHPQFNKIINNYRGLVSIDLPVWTAIAISSKAWLKVIKPDPNFIFHLWFPDIAMQFMNNNFYVCTYSDIIIKNNVNIKLKYGIAGSVEEGKKQNGKMEKYGNHLNVWKKKWGFCYENPNPNVMKILTKVKKNSILTEMLIHYQEHPLKRFFLN